MYRAKKGDSFYIGLKCLEMMWMFKPDPREEGPLVYLFRTAMSLIYIVFLQIGPLLHFIMVAAKYEVGVSDALADTIGGLGFTLVYFKILVYHHRISTVFKNLVDHEMFGKPKTFDAVKRRCEMLALFILGYCPIGVFIYGAVIIHESRNSVCLVLQKGTDRNLFCALIYPLWFPVNIRHDILLALQIIICIVLYTPAAQVCLLMYESTFSLISHIEFLMDQIDAAFCEGNEKKRFWLLRYCAEYHMHISKMGKDVSSLHETLTGHLAVIWAVSFGCIFNQVIETKQFGAFLYLLGYLFILCCFVEAGQSLQTKSESVADRLYNIPWYIATVQEQKSVMLMITRAQIPIKLSATPFGYYDFGFFIMIIKTAYSYLTLLQNVV